MDLLWTVTFSLCQWLFLKVDVFTIQFYVDTSIFVYTGIAYQMLMSKPAQSYLI